MIEKLFNLVQDNRLRMTLTHSKGTDFNIIISQAGLGSSEEEIISRHEGVDVIALLSKAYVDLTEWLSEHKGGY